MSKLYFPGPDGRFYPSIVVDGASLEGIPGTVRELEPDQVPADGCWFEVPDDFIPPAPAEGASAAPEATQNPDPSSGIGEPVSGPENPDAHTPEGTQEIPAEAGAEAPAHPFAFDREG